MTFGGARRWAWTAFGVSLGLLVGHLVLGYFTGGVYDRDDILFTIGTVLVVFAFGVPGALIVSRQPRNTIGWLLIAIPFMAVFALIAGDYAYEALVRRPGMLPAGRYAAWIDRWAIVPTFSLFIPLFLLFPDGKVPSSRWRPALWLAVGAPAVTTIAFALTPGRMTGAFADLTKVTVVNPFGLGALKGHGDPTGIAGAATLVAAFLAGASLFFRFRNRHGDERQQVKWLAFVGIACLGELLLLGPVSSLGDTAGNTMFLALFFTLSLGIPAACAIAILKYHLYDLDVVVNKTLVFGALAAFITAVYVAIVVGIGHAVGQGNRPNVGLSILATAVVAVAFQPFKDRVQHLANRLVYGKRATPYEVLSEFSERMSDMYATEDLLPRMARILAEGTGASRADVWLKAENELRATAFWPADSKPHSPIGIQDAELPTIEGADRALPVSHRGELLGALSVTKARGDPLRPAEEKLMEDLASGAGLVLRNVRLTAELLARLDELKASRQRIVAAQDEERRRLERNLHDGAQQQLVALQVRLSLAERQAEDDCRVRDSLGALKQEAGEALENLRDLARGIYPPLLADQGLGAALRAQARKAAIPVVIEANHLPRYSQETEAAVFFCVLEALQNVAKYAGAHRATVRLHEDAGFLAFEITDDGRGFDTSTTSYGTGLQGMADRLAAQSGTLEVRSRPGEGTTVIGRMATTTLEVTEA